jgi:VanZ family protein
VPKLFSSRLRDWAAPLGVAATIFIASTQSHIPGPSIEGIDKVVHFSIYGLLATLVVRLGQTRASRWITILLVSLYGISDEWHQSFTPGRSVEFADWVADTLGAATAVALYTFWAGYRRWLEISVSKKRRVEK